MPVGFPDYYGGLTLPVTVAEGGTGQTSFTSKAMLYGAGTSKLIETNVGASGQILQIDPTTLVPTFDDLSVDASVITGILAIANGGTGSSSPALTAGNGISITGTWPNNTITNSQYSYFSSGILALTHGGTGTSAPALTAGNGISITGTWPDNTIALASQPELKVPGNSSTPTLGSIANAGLAILNQTGIYGLLFGVAGTGAVWAQVQRIDSNTTTYTLQLNPSGGAVQIGTDGLAALTKYNGVALVGDGIPYLVAEADLTGQTASKGNTTLYTPSAAGFYEVSTEVRNYSPTGTSTLTAAIAHTQNGGSMSQKAFPDLAVTSSQQASSQVTCAYADASTPIYYNTAWSSGGSGDSYDIHIRVKKL